MSHCSLSGIGAVEMVAVPVRSSSSLERFLGSCEVWVGGGMLLGVPCLGGASLLLARSVG